MAVVLQQAAPGVRQKIAFRPARKPQRKRAIVMNNWNNYSFRIDDGISVSTVYHVAHLPAARRIFDDGCLRGGLIYDESKLNKSRICVTWLSANTWVQGSIYGNIQFAYDWEAIIEGRRVYWVEAMTGYNPHAYRFLLTKRNMSRSSYVVEYDPTKDKGPLRVRDGIWYRHENYTSEFMLEADIPLEKCKDLDFISHNERYCQLSGSSCRYRRDHPIKTAARVLAFLLGYGIQGADHLFVTERQDSATILNFEAEQGVIGVLRALGNRKTQYRGKIKKRRSRKAILRGALALYGSERDQEAKDLVGLLHSQEVFEKALREIVEEKFGITNYTFDR